jgi:hypothetical protein
MQRGETEPPAWLQEPGRSGCHRLDRLHVHDGHVADDGVERCRITEREESFLIHRVGGPVFDLPAVRTSPLEHPVAEVDCKHLSAEFGHPARELAVPARDLEDPLSRLEPEQPFDRRLDEMSLPGRPGLHVLVPEAGELVPRGTDVVVQAAFFAHTVKRIRRSEAVWRIALH